MVQDSVKGQTVVEQILNLMDGQRDRLFLHLAGITDEKLWFCSGPGEWSIGENIDHLRVIYASFLPWFQAAWIMLSPLARLRRSRPYAVKIDNVYHRPGFPQKVGWMWPPRHTPARPVSLDNLREGVERIHSRVRSFYAPKDPDLLGQVTLWDPAIGTLNLIQALRVGVYHDEVHIASIREMMC